MMEHDVAEVTPPVRYAVTEGWVGRIAAGPYLTYDNAVMARRTLVRPWRMFWRRIPYCVQPVDQHGNTWEPEGGWL